MKGFNLAAAWLCIAVLAAFTLSVDGCKKASNPAEPVIVPITTDIFPLTVGHKITYTGYLRQAGIDSDVTTQTYTSTWTVVSNDTATPLGGTSNLVIDSITSPVPSASLLYVLRDPPTGDANFSFMQTVSYLGKDTLTWVLAGDSQDGVGTYWPAFKDSIQGDTVHSLWIVGHFVDQESLSVGGQMFYAYRLTISADTIVGGVIPGTVDTPLATYWFAPDIGPVKIIVDATETKSGYDWEFKGKNF
jgi:hypothetical protein